MTPGEIAGFAGLAVSLLAGSGGLFAYLNGKRTARIEKGKAETADQQARTAQTVAEFGANLELNEYIDARVEKLVEKQTAPLHVKIAAMEKTERTRTLAMTRILRTISNQWPTDHPGPHLDASDIAAVEDTIPPAWLKPARRTT